MENRKADLLRYIVAVVGQWPENQVEVRMDKDGEICFSNSTRHDFYPKLTSIKPYYVDVNGEADDNIGFKFSKEQFMESKSISETCNVNYQYESLASKPKEKVVGTHDIVSFVIKQELKKGDEFTAIGVDGAPVVCSVEYADSLKVFLTNGVVKVAQINNLVVICGNSEGNPQGDGFVVSKEGVKRMHYLLGDLIKSWSK